MEQKKKAIKYFIGNVETYENKVTFESNTARLAVLAFFGGWIDIRIPDKNSATPPTFLTFIRSYNAGYAGVNSDISSSASKICICENSRPITNGNSINIQTFLGRSF